MKRRRPEIVLRDMRLVPLTLLLALATPGFAEMIGPTNLPAPRIIKNLEAKIKANPRDSQSEYMLGRVYYSLYCSRDPRVIALYGTDTTPRFPNMHTNLWEFQDQSKRADDTTSITNAKRAIEHLQKAIRMGGGEPGLYQLTLACAFEASVHSESKILPGGTPFKKRALDAYIASFRESRAVDLKRPYGKAPMTWENWISVEACAGILRLDPNTKLKPEIEKHQKQIESMPTGPITPLIFSLDSSRSLADLLDPAKIVSFDLDGTGAPQKYSWVKPDTAFLVWMPKAGTQIRSGRQLFGSATWWLMPRNAYEAMAMLDDNSDGWLSGRELDSLAVWQDLNQNGISEPNEVASVGIFGITGLKTTFTGHIGESMISNQGLRLSDGRMLPTYDWVTRAK